MIDLHIHTNHSDGEFSVMEILEKAEKEKLDIISITDHDSIGAYDEIKEKSLLKVYTGKIVVGTEIKCVYDGIPMEVLAYGFQLDKLKETDYIATPEKKFKIQSKYLEYLKKKGKEIGLVFDEDLKLNKKNPEFSSAAFHREILKHDGNAEILKSIGIDINKLFYRVAQSNPNTIFYIDETNDFPKMEEVVEAIHKANGLVFLAHLFEYPIENYEDTITNIVKEVNLDGIECYHSSFTKEQSDWIIEFCKKNKKLMSGGSDYHGKVKPKVKFARAMNDECIPNELVEDWINNINMYN